jgi:hypothetical protein
VPAADVLAGHPEGAGDLGLGWPAANSAPACIRTPSNAGGHADR